MLFVCLTIATHFISNSKIAAHVISTPNIVISTFFMKYIFCSLHTFYLLQIIELYTNYTKLKYKMIKQQYYMHNSYLVTLANVCKNSKQVFILSLGRSRLPCRVSSGQQCFYEFIVFRTILVDLIFVPNVYPVSCNFNL